MAREEDRIWPGDPTGQTRAEREPFRYRAYVPDPIAEAEFVFPGPVAAATSEAERAVADLNQDPPQPGGLEAVARQLLRAESVASSRIEGLELSHRRLAREAYLDQDGRDGTARSVLGNIRAMERAIEIGASSRPVTVDDVLALHRILMEATRDAQIAGRIRDKQNWLGGSTFTPRGAEFIPPPPEYVMELLKDLATFVNRDDLPAVEQAAIAHTQFETIHPFADGNGRVGRCLIHVVLRRRRLAPRYVPPISLVLAGNADAYVKSLTTYREGNVAEWSLFFAHITTNASRQAKTFARRIAELQGEWREVARVRRSDAGAGLLIEQLPSQPILDSKTARALLGGSAERARLALNRLEKAGVLRQVTVGERNRVWEVSGLYEALNNFERQLATPEGEGLPSRPAPATAGSSSSPSSSSSSS